MPAGCEIGAYGIKISGRTQALFENYPQAPNKCRNTLVPCTTQLTLSRLNLRKQTVQKTPVYSYQIHVRFIRQNFSAYLQSKQLSHRVTNQLKRMQLRNHTSIQTAESAIRSKSRAAPIFVKPL
jgi:hypothetical protein